LTETYVTTGEVTTLEHEVGDDSVERRALVAETLLASAESTEVLSGLGDLLVVEVEVDATTLVWREGMLALMKQKA
jgi:hypothetical protein